jgi:hypothetical protein
VPQARRQRLDQARMLGRMRQRYNDWLTVPAPHPSAASPRAAAPRPTDE